MKHDGSETFAGANWNSSVMRPEADIAVIILTLNEEANVAQALQSVCGWAREVFVLDSFSTDRTLEIAREHGAICVQNRFEGFVQQRNFALDHLPINAQWIFFLDADEWMPSELRNEISALIARNPPCNGFYVKFRLIWMGRWIRRGYYPTFLLRMMRRGKGRWEERAVNEHVKLEGETGFLSSDLIHQDRKGLAAWIEKHNRYAVLEACELLREGGADARLRARLFGSQAERKRWLRERLWNRLSPLLRPPLYFSYRYVLRGGFLDGRAGFIYHFLQALWYPMLIDINYLESKRQREMEGHRAARADLPKAPAARVLSSK